MLFLLLAHFKEMEILPVSKTTKSPDCFAFIPDQIQTVTAGFPLTILFAPINIRRKSSREVVLLPCAGDIPGRFGRERAVLFHRAPEHPGQLQLRVFQNPRQRLLQMASPLGQC